MSAPASSLRHRLAVLLAVAVGFGVVLFGGRDAARDDAPYFPPWYLDPSSPTPPEALGPNVPRTIEDLERPVDDSGLRCREGPRQHAFVLWGDRLVWHGAPEELMAMPGHLTVEGKQADLSALPVSALLARWPEAEAVEVWPCRGEPLRLESATLRASPDRWLLVLTPRRFLKLVDREADLQRPVLRALAALRLVPRG